MSYQSPLHILKSLNLSPDDLDSDNLNRLRKKLLAEFNLTDEITIEINGNQYTKDEVLKTIEKLRQIDDLAIHKAIYEQNGLSRWLENPNEKGIPFDKIQRVLDDFPEKDWFREFVKQSFHTQVKSFFKNRQFGGFSDFSLHLNNFDEDLNYDILETFQIQINQIINNINEATKNPNIKHNKSDFGFISESNWTDFLNSLPSSFESVIDSYLVIATNYTVAILRKDLEWTCEISSQLLRINNSNESLKEAITQRHNYYERESIWEGLGKILLSILGIFIVFVIFIIIVRGCGNKSPHQKQEISANDKEVHAKKLKQNQEKYITEIKNYFAEIEKLKQNPNIQWEKTSIISGDDHFRTLYHVCTDCTGIPNNYEIERKIILMKNQTNYDLIVFSTGEISRSYAIRANSESEIEIFRNSKLLFYVGKEMRIPVQYDSLNKVSRHKFHLWFSKKHPQYGDFRPIKYVVKFCAPNATLTFDNEVLKKRLTPKTDNIMLETKSED
jgi:hypothetical protein